MESSNELKQFFEDLPLELREKITYYLNNKHFLFFAQTSKPNLKAMRAQLRQRIAAMLRPPYLNLSASTKSTWIYSKRKIYRCGMNKKPLHQQSSFTVLPLPDDNHTIQQLIAGENHTLMVTNNGLYGFGSNELGQLGLGNNKNLCNFTSIPWPAENGNIQQITVGATHTLILTNKGLYGCGSNYSDQLGLEEGKTFKTFIPVPLPLTNGAIQQILTSNTHTVIQIGNDLYGCGDNSFGQLGLGDSEKCKNFTALRLPPNSGNIQQIAVGCFHTVILTDKGLYGCGDNSFGQLGLGDSETCKNFTALRLPPNSGTIQQIAVGGAHTVILTDKGLYACGSNYWGQLSLKKIGNYKTFVAIPWTTENGTIQQLITGSHHIVVVTDKGLYACGSNQYGQLGVSYVDKQCTFTAINSARIALPLFEQLRKLSNFASCSHEITPSPLTSNLVLKLEGK